MEGDITASTKELMDQAAMTASHYYGLIAKDMDQLYGKGWSKEHSETVARLCQAAAQDFHTAVTNRTLQQLRDKQFLPLEPIQVELLGGE